MDKKTLLGGQAVMEGVMMRLGDCVAIAVRTPSGDIEVVSRPWKKLGRFAWLGKPFIRGVPVLAETLVNGLSALNFSAKVAMAEEDEEASPWAMALTMGLAIVMAMGLFVALPHGLTLLLNWLGLTGGVDSLAFHVWDGVFKVAILVAYVGLISLLPEIKRVFAYHGAEHKVIWAYERGEPLTPESAACQSRLHPRCGTAFLLVVMVFSVGVNAALVPLAAKAMGLTGGFMTQVILLGVKLLLMFPIASLAYEAIRLAAIKGDTPLGRLLTWPGLCLQRLTTFEPDHGQLEVALAALREAAPHDDVNGSR